MRWFILAWMAVTGSGVAYGQPSVDYASGLADRRSYETWYSSLSGDYRSGVEFWAAHRSVTKDATCFGNGKAATSEWMQGCLSAQQRLAPWDARRKSNANYRLGWNSIRSPDLQQTVVQNPSGDAILDDAANKDHYLSYIIRCRSISSALQRLDCYDQIHIADESGNSASRDMVDDSGKTSSGMYGLSDLPAIRKSTANDPAKLLKSPAWMAHFEASGKYGGFEKVPVPQALWMVSVLTQDDVTKQVSCFVDHEDRQMESIPIGSPVKISGGIGMLLDDSLVLGKECVVTLK